ncbi:MAG: TIGR00645 family protein [Thiobacillus sp.]|nr:TIGR00645 family protein [Thiobacillus sp.]
MKHMENHLERMLFASRWLLVPFYIGLILALALLLVKFVKEFMHFVPVVFTGEGGDVIIGVLTLVDVVMVANLLIIIVFAGYENFVSRFDAAEHEDWPGWMGHVGFAELKMKLIGSIVAISGIELLKAFMHVESLSNEQLAWKVGIHMTFVVSGVLFALMDRITADKAGGRGAGDHGA